MSTGDQFAANQRIADLLSERREEIARRTVARHFQKVPDLCSRYPSRGEQNCIEDCYFHLDYLVQSLTTNQPGLFADYIGWARTMLEAYNVPAGDLAMHLECLEETLSSMLDDAAQRTLLREHLGPARALLSAETSEPPSYIKTESPVAALATEYLTALLDGRRHDASRLITTAVESGTSIRSIYLDVFQPAQHEIGRLWQLNRISVAQEHYCTAATQLIMSQLYPQIFSGPRNGRVLVATCVSGELHELGIRMVSDFFEMEGWDSFYLGANAPTATIVQALVQRQAHVLAISTTITTNVRYVADIIKAVRATNLPRLKILVGGYPFNIAPELYKEIGADGCARDAQQAIDLANQLIHATPHA